MGYSMDAPHFFRELCPLDIRYATPSDHWINSIFFYSVLCVVKTKCYLLLSEEEIVISVMLIAEEDHLYIYRYSSGDFLSNVIEVIRVICFEQPKVSFAQT